MCWTRYLKVMAVSDFTAVSQVWRELVITAREIKLKRTCLTLVLLRYLRQGSFWTSSPPLVGTVLISIPLFNKSSKRWTSIANLCTGVVEFEVGTPIGDYSLPVVTGGAERQEGSGIARAWIVVDPKVYPGWRRMPEGTVILLSLSMFCC